MLIIKDPIKIIEDAIPELQAIGNYGNTKTISYNLWDNRMKSIETKNLNKYKRSLSWVGLASYFKPCIIEYNGSYNTIKFNEAKYKLIRKYVMSDEFNIKQ